jgi:hypothetical protein
MGDKYSPKDSTKDELDDSFGENPAYPGRKRPSEWGAGKEFSRTPGEADAERSPTSKTPD